MSDTPTKLSLLFGGWLALCSAVAFSALASGTETFLGDEPPTFNDPDSLIVCPSGSVKRTRAVTYRQLDPVRLADATKVPPPGYVSARMLTVPTVAYPGGFFRKRRPAYASVSLVISVDGKPYGAQIVCSSGSQFEKPALEAVMRTSFSAATLHGKEIEDMAIIPFDFSVKAR